MSNKATRSCFCGCGSQTQSRFVPGHDARFHSTVKKTMRGLLDADEALAALPCDQAREEFLAYADKVQPKEDARKAKEEATATAKAEKAAAKAAAKAEAAVPTLAS